jgi:2-oxo-4-hydroxy-4-carboxy-5-ureidoimidazoline decarboxylase
MVRRVSGLERFNGLPTAEVVRELVTCAAAPGWAETVAAGRPYPDVESLTATALAALADLPWAQVAAALSAHPRIGERAAGPGRDATWSRREQVGVAGAGADVRAALAEANRRYEKRFDRIFLIFATGRTPAEVLAAARERLGNDEETERSVIRGELAKITELRLRRLVLQE